MTMIRANFTRLECKQSATDSRLYFCTVLISWSKQRDHEILRRVFLNRVFKLLSSSKLNSMALQHNPFAAPLQYQSDNKRKSKPKLEQEEKKIDNDDDSDKLQVLPLRIFGDNGSKFMCEQCTNVPLKVAACDAGHVFCQKCILDLYKNNQLCPVDKTQITSPALNNPVLDNMVKKEHVTCLYGRYVPSQIRFNFWFYFVVFYLALK